MSRVWGVSLLIVALLVVPVLVCGQGVSSGTNSYDPPSTVDLYVGYATNLGSTQYRDQVLDVAVDGDLDYATTHALYLGVAIPMRFGDSGFFRLAGSLTIPASAKVETAFPEPIGLHERDFSGDTIWGTAEGLLFCPIRSGLFVVAGFRWDHWQTSFSNPTNFSPFMPFAATDEADLTLNAYLPMVGMVSSWGGLTFGIVGFPVAFGDIEFRESANRFGLYRLYQQGSFHSGHLVEFFTEYALPIGPIANSGITGDISFFAKFSSLGATDTISYWWTDGFFTSPNSDTDFSFRRKLFVIGGKATINFNTPDLGRLL